MKTKLPNAEVAQFTQRPQSFFMKFLRALCESSAHSAFGS
jgi:hypothetical protein